jgi:hypothetical protein
MDCINDELDITEYRDKTLDDDLGLNDVPKEVIWNRNSTADYDARHREKKREYARLYYQKNKEKKKKQVKEWQMQNYQYLLLYQKENRAKKKERVS